MKGVEGAIFLTDVAYLRVRPHDSDHSRRDAVTGPEFFPAPQRNEGDAQLYLGRRFTTSITTVCESVRFPAVTLASSL